MQSITHSVQQLVGELLSAYLRRISFMCYVYTQYYGMVKSIDINI